MELINCPLCNKSLSSDARACPHCGHPNQYCPHCKTMSTTQGLKFCMNAVPWDSQNTGYITLIILLLCLGILPGIIAMLYLANVPYCPHCKQFIWERRPF